MTIHEVIAMPVAGNAYDDRHVWEATHAIVADETAPMPHRLAALAKMNELTGEDDPCTPEALAEYLELTVEAA
jgi:hypothetical protein